MGENYQKHISHVDNPVTSQKKALEPIIQDGQCSQSQLASIRHGSIRGQFDLALGKYCFRVYWRQKLDAKVNYSHDSL